MPHTPCGQSHCLVRIGSPMFGAPSSQRTIPCFNCHARPNVVVFRGIVAAERSQHVQRRAILSFRNPNLENLPRWPLQYGGLLERMGIVVDIQPILQSGPRHDGHSRRRGTIKVPCMPLQESQADNTTTINPRTGEMIRTERRKG